MQVFLAALQRIANIKPVQFCLKKKAKWCISDHLNLKHTQIMVSGPSPVNS